MLTNRKCKFNVRTLAKKRKPTRIDLLNELFSLWIDKGKPFATNWALVFPSLFIQQVTSCAAWIQQYFVRVWEDRGLPAPCGWKITPLMGQSFGEAAAAPGGLLETPSLWHMTIFLVLSHTEPHQPFQVGKLAKTFIPEPKHHRVHRLIV